MLKSVLNGRHAHAFRAPASMPQKNINNIYTFPAPPRLLDASANKRPESLTIRFSRAADLEKVVDLYSGARKDIIDPNNFVRARSFDELAEPVRSGAAALAIDENGDIRASALASVYQDGKDGQNNMTEIGAVMCDVGGVGLSKIIIAMLALKQTFDPRAGARVYAKVAQTNDASNKIFTSSLAWNQVTCETKSYNLFDVVYRAHGGKGFRDRLWYHFTDASQKRAADILQSCVDEEALKAKDGSTVALNTDRSSLWSTLHYHNMLSMS